MDSSNLVKRCHALRKVPIAELSPGDLRVLIGQQVGINHLVPRALAVLTDEPLIDGDYFPGDLLTAVTRLPMEFWTSHREWAVALHGAARQAVAALIQSSDASTSGKELLADLETFLSWPISLQLCNGRIARRCGTLV